MVALSWSTWGLSPEWTHVPELSFPRHNFHGSTSIYRAVWSAWSRSWSSWKKINQVLARLVSRAYSSHCYAWGWREQEHSPKNRQRAGFCPVASCLEVTVQTLTKKRNIAQILPEGEKGKKSSPSKEQWRLLNKRFSAKYLPQDKSIDKKRLSKSIFFFFMSWFFSLGDVQVETTKQKKILWKTQDRYFPLSIIGYFKFCYAKGIQTANCVNPEA